MRPICLRNRDGSSNSLKQYWCVVLHPEQAFADSIARADADSIKLRLQAFDSSALGGGIGGGGIMGRDADQSDMKTDGPPSGPSSDPAVS